jgi:hypothetical protein
VAPDLQGPRPPRVRFLSFPSSSFPSFRTGDRSRASRFFRYLVKNGSERVIDDARSHLSLIRVLRNFHYTDENAKDQGINGALSFLPPQPSPVR